MWVNKALDRDPRHLFARELLVGANWKKGDFVRQIEQDLKRIEARGGLSDESRAALKGICAEVLHVYKHEGIAGAHRWILKHEQRVGELISRTDREQGFSTDGASPFDRGNTIIGPLVRSAEAGDLDKAFEFLQRALDVREPGLFQIAVAPQWDSMRADRRFNQCLARMKCGRHCERRECRRR